MGRRFLRVLQLESPADLIAWADGADKATVAALTVELFAAAAARDQIARGIPAEAAELSVAAAIGPEVLTGSTRLKAGTATKLLLNIFTTLAMVQLGKVVENLMVDVHPTNAKLRDRAIRIVRDLTGVARETAAEALAHHGWSIRQALTGLKNRP